MIRGGYQFLENDFFELCRTREIGRIPMLLLIYLRGLYCRFQKPVFTWQDKKITGHLGISRSTLGRARTYLQTRGVIQYKSGIGNKPTEYTMLGSVLLPVIKMTRRYAHPKAPRSRHFDDSLNPIKQILKNSNGSEIFKGMTDEQREELKKRGIL